MNIKFFELRYLFKINKYIEFIPLTILNITNENIISIFFLYICIYIFKQYSSFKSPTHRAYGSINLRIRIVCAIRWKIWCWSYIFSIRLLIYIKDQFVIASSHDRPIFIAGMQDLAEALISLPLSRIPALSRKNTFETIDRRHKCRIRINDKINLTIS